MSGFVVGLAALVSLACSTEYAVGNCEITCTESCPNGFECHRGVCVRPGFDAARCFDEVVVTGETAIRHFSCQPLDVPFKARGGDTPLQWRVAMPEDAGAESLFALEDQGRQAVLHVDADGLLAGDYYELELVAEDRHGEQDEHVVSIEVEDCPTIELPRLDEPWCVGQEVNVQLSVSGGYGHPAWALSGQLPEGLAHEDGQIVGTVEPGSEGRYDLTVEVTDVQDPERAEGSAELKAVEQLSVVVDDCIRLTLPEYEQRCVGDDYALDLHAEGGSGDYDWEVELPEDFHFDEDAEVITTSTQRVASHRLHVTVRDDQGRSVSRSVEVETKQCPVVQTKQLSACAGARLEQTLQATDAVGELVWRKDDGPEDLAVTADGRVTWEPLLPQRAQLKLLVTDLATDAARQATIPLEVHAADEQECEPPLGLAAPPDACAGQLYHVQLQAEPAYVDISWHPQSNDSQPWPAWLTLTSDGVLSGTPPMGETRLYPLRVAMDRGGFKYDNFDLRVRRSCKFAVAGDLAGRRQLLLADVRQRHAPELQARILTADLAADVDVASFAFSGDGRRLAYLAASRTPGTADRLFIEPITQFDDDHAAVELTEYADLPIARIHHFAWSDDAARMALLVELEDASQRLVLFDVTQPTPQLGEPKFAAWAGVGELWWLDSLVCFMGESTVAVDDQTREYVSLTCHVVDPDTGEFLTEVAALQPASTYNSPSEVHFADAAAGLFTFRKADSAAELMTTTTFRQGTGLHPADQVLGVPDPSLGWMAQHGIPVFGNSASDLGIFRVEPGLDSAAVPLPEGQIVDQCEELLTWEQTGQAVACDGPRGLRVGLLQEGVVTQVGDVAGAPRLEDAPVARSFTRDARWLVFDTIEQELRAVDLSAGAEWNAAAFVGHDRGPYGALMPVGQAEQMLWHFGDELALLDLGTGHHVSLSGSHRMDDPYDCVHAFALGGRHQWCGSTAQRTRFVVNHSGDAVVFVDAVGQANMVDLLAPDLFSADEPAIELGDATVDCSLDGCAASIKPAP